MKELLTGWIVNLTLVSILSSLITRLLPGKSYLPYLKIFCGFLMILTLFQPVLKLSGLEDEIEIQLKKNMFEGNQYEIQQRLIEIEEKQKEEWENQYKEYLEGQPDGTDNKNERDD
ncbi:MAG: hypothetical protein E7253_06305 [Lachnospiraceae bacterium]|nr:hypothetical protein [Lachnospiraceae bacterium]